MVIFIRLLVFLFISVAIYPNLTTGKVVRVIDGDSIHVKINDEQFLIVRLFGVDAPELDQRFGQRSKKYLSTLILNQVIQLQFLELDNYGRRLAIIFNDEGLNINLDLIETGHAWVYQNYFADPKWLSLQRQAKEGRKGLWRKTSPIPPWVFRRK